MKAELDKEEEGRLVFRRGEELRRDLETERKRERRRLGKAEGWRLWEAIT